MYKLRYFPDPILYTKCESVEQFNEELFFLLDEMKRILLETRGIAISANQIGSLKRVFILKEKNGNIIEFINPEIVEATGVANIYEGCLSSPNVYEKVYTRSNDVTVIAYNRKGEQFTGILEGIEAVAAQHENDHLDGVFWFDKLPNREKKRSAEKRWQKERKKLGV